jgi:Protein of unknown function (DUF2442)
MVTNEEFLAATRRANRMQATTPMAVDAHYNKKANRVVISLSTKVEVMFNPADAQGLEDATSAELSEIEITPSGFGLHWPQLDADIYVPALLEGSLGSRKWMAARLGAQGGKARSLAKRTAARANGALGGRPRKSANR